MQVFGINSVNFQGPGKKQIIDKAVRGRVEVEECAQDLTKMGKGVNKFLNEIANIETGANRQIKPKTRRPLFVTNKK